jgi:hypothetical protein
MITFLTLFLGLTTGTQPVELAIRGEPARVVLSLDGEPVAERNAPPWRFDCDFGAELAPRRLEAVAYDAEGVEIARAAQTVNLSSRFATLALALEEGPDGWPVAVRPAWQSAEHPRPDSLALELDGAPLPAPSWERVELPALDPGAIHFVVAEAVFPDGTVARAETAFGGALGRTVSTDNTAVAVVARRGRALREAADTAGLLTAGGAPVTVLSVEHGAVDLVAVVTPAAAEGLTALRVPLLLVGREQRSSLGIEIYRNPAMRVGLQEGDRLFQIDPVPEIGRPGEEVYEIYDRRGPFAGGEHGLVSWLAGLTRPVIEPPPDTGSPRPADAVAVAALQTVAFARPRAVLLVLGRDEDDASRFSPGAVREYLRRLRVPLAVWYVEPPLSQLVDTDRQREIERRRALVAAGQAPGDWKKDRRQRLDELRKRWGEVIDASEPRRLIDAARALRKSLEEQRILWIDGAWLPQEVELTPAAAEAAGGIRWAG